MIVKEFLGQRITPLQVCSRPLWEYTDVRDMMRLHVAILMSEEMDGALGVLLGHTPEDRLEDASPLYCYEERLGMVAVMPAFDEWGLVGVGHDGPRGNPSTVVLDSSDGDSAEDSEATVEEENVSRAPPRHRRRSLRDFEDDDATAADEQPQAVPPQPTDMVGGEGLGTAATQLPAGVILGEGATKLPSAETLPEAS